MRDPKERLRHILDAIVPIVRHLGRGTAEFVCRALQTFGSLIKGKILTPSAKKSDHNGSAGPNAGLPAIVSRSRPSPFSAEIEDASQQTSAGSHRNEASTVGVPGAVETHILDTGTGAAVPDPAPTQSDTTAEPRVASRERASPSLPSDEVPAEPSNGNHQKTSDPTPPVLVDGSNLVAPGTQIPAEVKSERGRDDGPNRPEEQAEEKERSVVPPEERGGRPRRGSADKVHGKPRHRLHTTRRPEIVCWKRGREWVVGVEIPDQISQASISVLQANDSLSEDDSRAGCWPLATLATATKVQVVVSGHNRPITVPLGDDVWLLFKLSGRGLEQGRMVQHVSSGSYLAIVPKTWERDEEKAGSPPTTPEPTFLEGYLAHFFDLPESASSRIAFRNQLGQSIVIDSGGPRFHLVGPKIHDESGRMGPLFGGSPPQLGIMNGRWSDVQTIVVGQEGSGHQRWRESFEPKADRTQQELPHKVLERQAGWYFLRFYYDSRDTLIDSLDFRFVAGLKEISIPTAGPVPSPDGHVAQTVEVHHDASYNVMPAGQECAGLKMEQGTGKTIVTIRGCPIYS